MSIEADTPGRSRPQAPEPAAPRPQPPARLPVPEKAQIALLPPFAGLVLSQIEVPDTAARIEAAASAILSAGMAGFDTESKPTFKVGELSDGPHIVQFALADRAYIFQLHRPACQGPLRELLRSMDLVKAGFGLGSDRSQIQAKLGLVPNGVLDLNQLFLQRGYRRDIGVRSAVALVFGQRFAKSRKVTTTNWAQTALTSAQLVYAANDAWAAWRVLRALEQPAPGQPAIGHPAPQAPR